jgi:hypothetical protein
MLDNDYVRRLEIRTACPLVQVGDETEHHSGERALPEVDNAQQGSRGVLFPGFAENGESVLSCSEVRGIELCREDTGGCA